MVDLINLGIFAFPVHDEGINKIDIDEVYIIIQMIKNTWIILFISYSIYLKYTFWVLENFKMIIQNE